MEIKKILNIDSPVHLYRILEKSEEVIDVAEGDISFDLIYFRDCAYEYLYGCKCEADSNYDRMNREYVRISEKEDVILHLKSFFECDDIFFMGKNDF
jgi:hypothetical protein